MIRLQPSIYAGLFVLLLGVPWSATFAETDPVAQSVPFSFTSGAASWTAGLAIHMEDQNTDGEELDELGTDAAGPSASAANWNNQGTNGYSYLASSSYESGAFVIALNTTGKANINLSWKALTIVNNANVNYLRLQYRVGTSGDFTSLGPANTYTGGAAAATYTNVALPAAANNQSVVQVRWFYFESSSNNRDSLALDNVYAYEVSASAPEISIVGTNKLDILTGDVTPSPADGTDFRAVTSAGTVAITNVFGITNSGTAILNITGVSTSSATAGAATNFVVIAWPATVTAGTVSNLAIRFDPSASGLRTAIVTVANNDTSEASYTFAVQGTGTVPPSVTTSVGTATGTTTATVGGNVTADGGLTVTNRGVCYKTSAGVTIGDNKTPSGTGTGTFTANLTSLAVNTLYYYVAYAQNSDGTTLNGELQFWTWANAPSAPTVANPSSSTLDVTVNENGNPVSTLFSIQTTNSSLYVQTNGTLGATEHWQTDAAWGVKTVTGLSPSSNYGFRVRSQNGVGVISAWSAVGNASTSAGAAPPSVTTSSGTATGTTTATVGGNVTADGGATVTNRGVCYKTSAGVTIGDNKTQSASGTGPFTVSLTSLAVNTLYYYVAYAQNSAGTTLDGELDFWTWANAPSAPTVNGATVSQLNVTVNENGNPGTTLFSIQTTNNNLYVQTNGTLGATEHWQTDAAWGSIVVTGLGPGSNYGFRVRAQNGVGVITAWSTVDNGTTLATSPTVTTTVANPTNATTATAGGNVTADGGATVTNRGVVWASTAAPTVPGQQTTNATGTGSYSSTLTNLTPGATYYYRAFAQNIAGTSYGTEYTLTTPCFAGVVTGVIASVTNSTGFTASWSNFAGATGYALDVATSSTFSAAGGGNYGQEPFTNVDGGTTSSYLTRQWTNNGVAWTGFLARIDQTIDASEAITLQNASGAYLTSQPITGGVSEIRVTHQLKFTGADSFDIFVNGIKVATNVVYSSSVQTAVVQNLNISGAFTIMITNHSGGRVAFDNVIWTNGGGSAASYVPGYSNLAVSGTSQAVSGLEQGKTYYFRVRATNDHCITANSSTGSVTTLVTAAPEMAMLGTNLAVILDGDVTPSLLDGTDFGDVSTASVTKDHTYTVTNAGTLTLTLSNIVISGAASADYTVQTALSSSSLGAGATATFTIRFDPSVAGARAATITLANNDGDENPYNFDITGNGVAPAAEIALLGSNLAVIPSGDITPTTADGTDYGSVSVASGTASSTFTITNSGSATLTISGVTTSGAHAADFRVTTAPGGTVAAGATTTFIVQFDPSVYGGRTGVLSVSNSDSDENPYTFTVRGDGIITLAEALDNVSLVWTTRGDAVWFGQAPTNHDGVDAAQSGPMGLNNATSTLETVVFGPGTVDFWWQVSSEDGYDYLNFQIDGVEQDFITGAMPWSQTNFAISSGTHTLQWAYVKDVSASNGADAGWVDQVTYTADGPLSGFSLNGSGTNLTDAQLAVAVTVRVNIADADGINWNGATISPQPNISPYLSISNPAGGQIVAPVAFTSSGHTDGETATTVTGLVTASSISTGSPFRVQVVYADNAGNVATGEFAFAVSDDDGVAPTISSAEIAYGGVASRYFAITTNASPVTLGARGGTFTTVWYNVTDADLNEANARNLRFAFGVRDAGSGIARGTVGTTNTVMSFSVGDLIVGNFTNYSAALSSANYTNATTTNVWSFPSGFFSGALINSLMATSNRVAVTAPDDDADRLNDSTVLYDQLMGWLGVVDDDAAAPILSSVRLGAVGDAGGSSTVWSETMGASGATGDPIATHESNNRFDNDTETMSGTGDMRNTSASSGYTGASGGFNVMFNSFTETFQIGGINALAWPNLTMQFGVKLGAGSADNDDLKAEYSTNGTDWVDLPFTVTADTAWQLVSPSGSIPSSASLSLRLRRTSTGTSSWDFRLDDIALVSVSSAATNLTDGQLASGVAFTGLVQDAVSGIYGTNTTGAFAPTVTVFNASGTAVYGSLLTAGPANGVTSLSAFSSLVTLAPGDIALGVTYTSRVVVTDYDQDRTGDSLSTTHQLAFVVTDDDTNAPVISGMALSGATTNLDLTSPSAVLTGLVSDASLPLSSLYYELLDGLGAVQASGSLFADAAPVAPLGHVAIIGYDSSAAENDEFSFVVLKELAAGTRIVFTDSGYDATDTPPYFRSDEGTDVWTAPHAVTPGEVFRRDNTLTLSDQGDQIFALTNSIAITNGAANAGFLFGLNFNGGGAPWQTDNNSENDSTLPSELTGSAGTNHVDVFDHDAGYYSGIRTGTVAHLMAAIINTANWTRTASGSIDLSAQLQPFTVLHAVTGTLSTAGLSCGLDYTVRVVAVDGDTDRTLDVLGTTNQQLQVRTTGVGGEADLPVASNLLVNGAAAGLATTLSDATMRTGGWDMAFSLSHEVGVFTNAASPSFRVINTLGEALGATPWSNGVVAGDTYFFTNNSLAGVPYAQVATGLHQVVWSASNQGSCVASIVDRSVFASGTNVFTVVDDDTAAPVLSGFALQGGSGTVSVDVALSGFAITGLVQDAGSGVALASEPPYALFYSLAGAVIGSNTFTGGSDGSGMSSPVALTNWFSGLTLACGNSYTVRVFAADADADRTVDRAAATSVVLVVTTSGAGGSAPTAENLLVNNQSATVATITDSTVHQGGWTMALAIAHSTDPIVTNGPGAPTFTVYNTTSASLYAASPLSWSNIVKVGLTYYATNSSLPTAATNLITTGSYTLVWSAQSEGLCYGSASGSGTVSPGTNRFTVVDDDNIPPNLYGVSVAGGSGASGGGTGCADPTATNLNAGDIAIFAMNTKTRGTTNNDSFAFVALVDLPAGTRIKFTDNGWSSTMNAFRNNEGTLTWMATNCVSAGTVVRWIATNNPTLNHGVITTTNGSFAPNIEGEQILAYQGSASSPNFLYALNDRLGGVWDLDAVDSHSSAIPPGLLDGYTCVAVGEFDNVIINTNNLAISGDREQILYYIGARESWIGGDDHVYDLLAYNFVFPDAGSGGGTITDHDMLVGGWTITGLVQDVGSGVAVSNGLGLRYDIFNTNAALVLADYFTTVFTNGSKLLHAYSNAMVGGAYANIQLGVYTARMSVGDADADRVGDVAERITNVPFVVTDDDVDLPQIGYFTLNGQTTITNAADLLGVVISGQVRDVTSGLAFQSAPPSFEVLDSFGSVALSGSFAFAPVTDGDGLEWTNIWTVPLNLGGIADCGIYTVRVTVADADDDRPDDRRATNQFFLISVASGSGDTPTASNLLVNGTAASVATLTDAELAAGTWSLSMEMHHPLGLLLDPPNTPSFDLRDPADVVLFSEDWTNLSTLGGTVYATNAGLPTVAYGDVNTGYHAVVWSGRSQGGCYGLALDSALILTTNRFLVVDDDTVGPNTPTNTASTAAYWTNQPVVTVTWDTGSVSDVSGVLTYRFSTNTPATIASGNDIGSTNTLTLTNLIEGIHTNWLFAVDNDQDRANDNAMGPSTGVVFYLDFTAPSQMTSLAAAPGAADDTSQIDLTWTPLSDAGNANLSPWSTYRVYYTQDGGDPTTNDTFVDSASYPELNTNTAASLVLQGLVMGAEYRVAMAGLDRAGNLGPLSSVQTVTLGQIIITQAYANAQSQPIMSWVGTGSAFYDVIYADDTGYSSRVDSAWKLAKTISGTTFTDEGGVNEGDGSARVAPMDLPANMMRFYRVAAVNSWIPSSGRAGGATTQIIVALKSVLSNGYNFVGMGMTPMVNSLGDFLGTNRLPMGDSMATSATVSVYSPTASGQPESNVWWLSSDSGWQYEFGGTANTQAMPYPFTGYNLLIPTNTSPTNLLLVGRVPWTNFPSFSLQPQKYHIITLNTPRPSKMSEVGLRDILTRGSRLNLADEIRVLHRGLGPLGSPRARIYVNTSGQYTYHTGGSGSAENFIIQPDDAVIVYTLKLAAPVVWQPTQQFEFPRVQITNALSAAPAALAQAPLSVTATSAILRGLVNPNSLATLAHIKYGPTTNYGSVIGVTNLSATNIAIQLSAPISGLSTGTLYYFQIWASNSAGVSRFGTGSFYTLGLCTNSVPGSIAVSAGDGASASVVALSWSDGTGEDGYSIYRHTINNSGAAVFLASATVNATGYNDATATPGQEYYYWLKATNCAGASAFGAGDDGYRKLSAVTGLAASYNSYSNKVALSWSATAGATGYGIWRHTADASGSASYLVSTGAGVTNYDDASAVADTDYYYWVRATNATSSSQSDFQGSGALGRRNSVAVPVLSTPTASSITTAGAQLGATVLDDGGSTLTSRGTAWGGAPMPVGNVQSEGGTALGAFAHTRSGMSPGTLYYYRGWASNSAGLGYSPDGSFWTIPSAPVLGAATNITTSGFVATWTAVPGATNYLVDSSYSSTFASYLNGYSNRPVGSAISVLVTGLSASVTNYWRVRAQNSGGISAYSSTNLTLTMAPEPTSQAGGLHFPTVDFTTMSVHWTNGNGLGRVVVARLGGAVDSQPVDGVDYTAASAFGTGSQLGAGNYVVYEGSGNTIAISGLSSNASYFFRVYEYNGSAGSLNYLTNSAAGNPGGQATLPLGCPVITVYPTTLPHGTNGVFYGAMLSASNGVAPYTFTHTSGTLPPNLVLSPTGGLSGTLVAAGTNSFTITATDNNGCTGSRPYTFVTH